MAFQIEKKQTNADRIRAMTDEDLAYWLYNTVNCTYCPIYCRENLDGIPCEKRFLDWLKQEV